MPIIDSRIMKSTKISKILIEIYNSLFERYGHRGWWPGDTPFEIAIGAILTQNTAWKNAKKALNEIKKRNLLEPTKLLNLRFEELASLIRPVGYFNLKAKRLLNFLSYINEKYEAKIEKMFAQPLYTLRQELLKIKGIGFETADSIILYAGKKPIFVIDAYTHRIFSRLKLADPKWDYTTLQALFMKNLPHDPSLFNDYHAQIVHLGQTHCLPKPNCPNCPILSYCPSSLQ
jgi:endonuclease-3 related protein